MIDIRVMCRQHAGSVHAALQRSIRLAQEPYFYPTHDSILISTKTNLKLGYKGTKLLKSNLFTVVDPGFSIGGAPTHWGGCQPPTRTLFGKNICENERN